MPIALKCIVAFLFFAFISLGLANTVPAAEWFSKDQNNQIKLKVDLFLSSVCPHCHEADAFFRSIEGKETWLEVHRYIINQDKVALAYFNQQLQQQQGDSFVVPTIFFCDSRWVGFAQAKTSGKELLRALNYCHQQIVTTGQLNLVTRNLLKQWAIANWYDSSITYRPSAAAFIPMMALTDALNPCAMFCIFALFAFLWLSPTGLTQLCLGLLFILATGLVHSIQQIYTAAFYQALTWLFIPMILFGFALLIYIGRNYFKHTNNNQLFRGILVILTAMAVQAYQQTCTPNFALVFEQWMASQQLSPMKYALYEFSYQLVYLLPLLLLVLSFSFLTISKRLDKYRLILDQVSWLFLAIIGLFFIFHPNGLSSLLFSFLALVLTLLLGWLIARRQA